MTDEELAIFLAMLAADLADKQERLGPEFERVWSDNVEELYEP